MKRAMWHNLGERRSTAAAVVAVAVDIGQDYRVDERAPQDVDIDADILLASHVACWFCTERTLNCM